MRQIVAAARILLGLILVVFGLNYFFHYLPETEISDEGMGFLVALLETGYMFPLIKAVEIAAGLLLIAGLFVPLALVVVAPVIVNIGLYHLLLDPNGWWIAVALVLLEILLAFAYRDAFRGVFQVRALPRTAGWPEESGRPYSGREKLVGRPIRS